MKINLGKILLSAALAIVFAATLASCHPKEGCPNKITQTGLIDNSQNS